MKTLLTFLQIKIFSTAIALFIAGATTVYSGEPCPEKIQAVLTVKVLSFIMELGGTAKSDITIGVLNGGEIFNLLQGAASKSKDKIDVKKVSIEDLDGIDVLFVPQNTKGGLVKQAKQAANTAKILTVAGDPQFVLDYDLTLSFHLVEGKPKILIDIAAGKTEGVKFAANLLKMADTK